MSINKTSIENKIIDEQIAGCRKIMAQLNELVPPGVEWWQLSGAAKQRAQDLKRVVLDYNPKIRELALGIETNQHIWSDKPDWAKQYPDYKLIRARFSSLCTTCDTLLTKSHYIYYKARTRKAYCLTCIVKKHQPKGDEE